MVEVVEGDAEYGQKARRGCTPVSSALFKRHSSENTPVRVLAKLHLLVGLVCRVQCDSGDILENTTFDVDKVEVAFHA